MTTPHGAHPSAPGAALAGSHAQPKPRKERKPKPPKVPATPEIRQAKRRRAATVTAIAAASALVLGGVSAAAVAGWAAANSTVVSAGAAVEPETVIISLPDYDGSVVARMPDVRGLSSEQAQQVLADAGIPVTVVTVSTRPAAGPENVVVQQTPVFGTINPNAVELVVAEAAAIPAILDASAASAVESLHRLGARVVQVREYVPGKPAGIVAAVDPAVGTAVPASVTLTITDTPSEMPFGDLRPANGSARGETDVLVGGMLYATAVRLQEGWGSNEPTAWALGGNAVVIRGSLALADSADPGAQMVLTARRDGTNLAQVTLTPGLAQAFEWDVRGASTLTISVATVGEARGEPVYLLDPVVLASFDQIEALTQ